MTKEFVELGEYRIRKSCIKKYKTNGALSINVYYTTSKTSVNYDVLTFPSKIIRNRECYKLDLIFVKP